MSYELLQRLDTAAVVALGSAGAVHGEQFLRHVGALARRLPEPDGRQLLVIARDRYPFAVALFAAWSRGHSVALPPNGQPGTIDEFVTSGRVAQLLHDTEGAPHGVDLRPWLDDSAAPIEHIELEADQHLVSVWTSGSTGEAVAHEKRAHQLLGEAAMLVDRFDIDAGARVLATVPAHHIYGLLFGVLAPLMAGGAFVRETPLHAPVVAKALADNDAGVLVSTPAHLAALRVLDAGQLPSAQLDRVFSSGAPLPGAIAQMLADQHGLTVTEVLGSTETGGIATRERGGADAGAWTALPGVEVMVGDEGRLLLNSPFVAKAAPAPYATDDRIAPLENGRFEHLGRMDDVVKIAGKRASIRAMEARLMALDGVADAAVFTSDEHDARGMRLRALAVAPGWSSEALRSELCRHFDPVVVPRQVRLCAELPRENNGKLRRARVVEAWASARRPPRGLAVGDDGAVRVGADLAVFHGHFPGRAVVPGVEQLRLAVDEARTRWPELGRLIRVERLKFRAPLRPGASTELTLDQTKPGRVRFVLGEVAEGRLVFEAEEGTP